MTQPIQAAYLAAEGFEQPLAEELARRGATITAWHGLLALSPEPPVPAAWSLNTWLTPREIAAESIGAAAAALRALQRNWGAYAAENHRRMALIEAKLPPLKPKPIVFPAAPPTGHLGAYTLLTPTTLLASPTQTSPWINGAPVFIEDREGPPSRAYLKLWEALTRLGAWPQPGETCLDLGASPGGWTYVLARLGAAVTAIDKAPLEPAIAAMPNVTTRQESAFALVPAQEPAVDWLFSDIIAYPARLLTLVQAWIAAGKAKRIVCTLKFQGATDHESAEAFAAISGGEIHHLSQNKHELTFIWQKDSAFSEEKEPKRLLSI
jgi:23S rRNA (cytidine2498-2'-O)-methyltransferase